MDIVVTLQGHAFFAPFPPEQVEAISRFTTPATLRKGDVVHQMGQKANHVFLLQEGRVDLRLQSRRRDPGLLISRLSPGELFGIAPLLGSDRYTTQAVCTDDSTILFIEAKPLVELLQANPQISCLILRGVARSYFTRYVSLAELVQRFLSDPSLR